LRTGFGMGPGDDAAPPGVGLGVGERQEKGTVVLAGGLAQLVAALSLQVGGDIEKLRVCEPVFAVGELGKLAWAVFDEDEAAQGFFGFS
jgi:hypothetical protein